MDFWSARSERLTAILSTVVAVAILAGGVTAFQSHHAPVDDVVQLESDFRFQLEVGFRHDVNERARRLEQLEKISQAWQQSSRSETDRQELAKWLLEATIRSMPGSIKALPVVPRFGEQTPLHAIRQSAEFLVEPTVVEEHVESVEANAEPTTQMSAPVTLPRSFVSAEPISTTPEPLAEPQPVAATDSTALASKPQVRINLTELAARIAGYHEGLNEIDTALLSLHAEDISALKKHVHHLEGMASDFRFAKLYYEALTAKERRAVTSLRPMTATLAEVERRIDRTQAALSGDYLSDFDAGQQDGIGVLRQQLANITAATK